MRRQTTAWLPVTGAITRSTYRYLTPDGTSHRPRRARKQGKAMMIVRFFRDGLIRGLMLGGVAAIAVLLGAFGPYSNPLWPLVGLAAATCMYLFCWIVCSIAVEALVWVVRLIARGIGGAAIRVSRGNGASPGPGRQPAGN
jgi:hypothetical protein